ncbi:hypothetical protein ACTXT7_005609 [Hymenolepis weldensis]
MWMANRAESEMARFPVSRSHVSSTIKSHQPCHDLGPGKVAKTHGIGSPQANLVVVKRKTGLIFNDECDRGNLHSPGYINLVVPGVFIGTSLAPPPSCLIRSQQTNSCVLDRIVSH